MWILIDCLFMKSRLALAKKYENKPSNLFLISLLGREYKVAKFFKDLFN